MLLQTFGRDGDDSGDGAAAAGRHEHGPGVRQLLQRGQHDVHGRTHHRYLRRVLQPAPAHRAPRRPRRRHRYAMVPTPLSSTKLYLVLPSFDHFHLSLSISTERCLVLPSFTEFYLVLASLTGFRIEYYWVLNFSWNFIRISFLLVYLRDFTRFTGFYWVLLGFTGFY